MFRSRKLTPTVSVAGLALAGLLIHVADSPDLLFGLGTDFISGVMFGVAIVLAAKAIFKAQIRS